MIASTSTTDATAPSTQTDSTTATNDKPHHRRYRMVALDLDGTLLQSNHCMSDATRDYLQELDKKGFTVAIATGRAATTVYETVLQLAIPHALPVVCSNGARGVYMTCSSSSSKDDNNSAAQAVSCQSIFDTPVPLAVARKTIQLAKELGYVSQYYVGEDIYADPREPHHFELTERYKELTGSKTKYVTDDFELAMAQGLSSKQLVLCREHEQDDMIAQFSKALSGEAYVIGGRSATIVRGSMGWFLEVLHPDVCKGNGLKNMCKELDITLDQVIAFGDGDNDLEFIQMAGRGIVMKNGAEVVKNAGDEVIEYTNDEDGVLKTLKQMESEGFLEFVDKK